MVAVVEHCGRKQTPSQPVNQGKNLAVCHVFFSKRKTRTAVNAGRGRLKIKPKEKPPEPRRFFS
jgi:hypothetical protein